MKKCVWKAGRNFLPILIVCAGIGLLMYPWLANWLYERSADSMVETYAEKTAKLDTADTDQMWEKARQYNRRLSAVNMALTDPFFSGGEDEADMAYESILSMDDSGYLCAVEIPKIKVYLPVYHGTSEAVLKKGVGHLEGSSFPTGGESTHVVLSAHTGLDTRKLFTDLTELEKGDVFFLHVLDQTLTYEVRSVKVVLPEEMEYLSIQRGKDLVTLLTCTPYGVNTHRLLVTGERIEFAPGEAEVIVQKEEEQAGSSQWMKSYRNAVIAGLVVMGEICIVVFVQNYQKRKRKRRRRRCLQKEALPRNTRMIGIQRESVRTRGTRRRNTG